MPATKLIIGIIVFSATWLAHGEPPGFPARSPVVPTQTDPDIGQQDIDEETQESTEIVDRALEVLAYAASLIPNFSKPDSRVAAFAALGDALWRYDQRRARDYFKAAFAALEKVDSKNVPENRQQAREQEQLKRWKSRTRRQLLSRIAQLDADLARELANRVGGEKEERLPPEDQALTSENVDLIFQRAYELLETDPEQAAALAGQTLTAGVSPWLGQFLPALGDRAPGLADQLFDAALNLILSLSNPPDVSRLHLLSPYVLQAPGGVKLEPARRYLTMMASALQAQSDVSAPVNRRLSLGEQYYLAKLYFPFFEQYAPELVPAMQTLLDYLRSELPAGQRNSIASNGREGNSAPDSGEKEEISGSAIGNMADLASPEGGESDASSGESEGGTSSTEALIMKLRDEKMRQRLLDAQRHKLARQALEQGKVDEAERMAQQIENPLKQFDLFVEIGQRLPSRGQTDRALIYFDKAEGLIPKLDDARTAIFLTFRLARAALKVNRERAFHYAQGAVTMLNRLGKTKPAQANLGRELIRAQALRGQLEAIFVSLGRADFEQAIYLALQLQEPEQRVLAEIAACRPVLAEAGKNDPQPTEQKAKEQ